MVYSQAEIFRFAQNDKRTRGEAELFNAITDGHFWATGSRSNDGEAHLRGLNQSAQADFAGVGAVSTAVLLEH